MISRFDECEFDFDDSYLSFVDTRLIYPSRSLLLFQSAGFAIRHSQEARSYLPNRLLGQRLPAGPLPHLRSSSIRTDAGGDELLGLDDDGQRSQEPRRPLHLLLRDLGTVPRSPVGSFVLLHRSRFVLDAMFLLPLFFESLISLLSFLLTENDTLARIGPSFPLIRRSRSFANEN